MRKTAKKNYFNFFCKSFLGIFVFKTKAKFVDEKKVFIKYLNVISLYKVNTFYRTELFLFQFCFLLYVFIVYWDVPSYNFCLLY